MNCAPSPRSAKPRNPIYGHSPVTRISSSATSVAMSGPTTCPLRTGSPANWAAASLHGCGATRISPAIFGPDFKILASLAVKEGAIGVEWRRLILNIQHIPKLSYERQHGILLAMLKQILRDIEAGGLEGVASTFASDQLILNGAGEFAIGGPEGDNGLSGKKLVVDHYGPSVSIGGGALSGKDPHKVDKCGALRARQFAKKLVRAGVDEASVILSWAPGGDAPFLVDASTSQGGVSLQVPRRELPRAEWFSIKAIVRDLELRERDWAADLRGGYFCEASAPWER
jgi:S-adenosylmethionine synthetase